MSGIGEPISTLAYVANTRVWSSPASGTPVGYSVIPAAGRRYPAMTSRQLMDHVLDTCGLRPGASRITGLDASTVEDHSRDRLAEAGLVLGTSEAFEPSASLRLGRMLTR